MKSDNVNIKNKNPTEPRSSVAERVLQAVEGGGRAESPAGPAHSTTCSQERSDRKSRAQHHLPRGANEKSRTLFKGHLAVSGDQSFARPGAEGQGLMPGHTSTWASRRTVQRSCGAGEKRTPEAQGWEPRLRRGWATILKTTEKKRIRPSKEPPGWVNPKVDGDLAKVV